MQMDTIRALRTKIQRLKLDSRGTWGGDRKLWDLEKKLEEEQRKLLELRDQQAEVAAQRETRNENPQYVATEFVSGRQVQTRRTRAADRASDEAASSDGASEASSAAASAARRPPSPQPAAGAQREKVRMLKKGSGGAGLGPPQYRRGLQTVSGTPAHSRRELQRRHAAAPKERKERPDPGAKGRKGFFAPGGGFTQGNVIALGAAPAQMLNPRKPEYYGWSSKTPQWRLNIAHAKRMFIMHMFVISAFAKAARARRKRDGLSTQNQLDRMGSLGVFVPLVLDDFTDRFIEQQQQFSPQVQEEIANRSVAGSPHGDQAGDAPEFPSPLSESEQQSPSETPASPNEAEPVAWPKPKPAGLQIPGAGSRVNSGLPPLPSSPLAGSPLGASPVGSRCGTPTLRRKPGLAPSGGGPKNASERGTRSRISTSFTAKRAPPPSRPSSTRSQFRRSSHSGAEPTLGGDRQGGGRRISGGYNPPRTAEGLVGRDLRARTCSDDALHSGNRKPGQKRSPLERAGAGGRVRDSGGIASRLMDRDATRERLLRGGILGSRVADKDMHSYRDLLPKEPPPQAFGPDTPVTSEEDLQRARQLMTTYVNRANSRWTDEYKWDLPQMFDVGQFEKLGGLDFQHYKTDIEQILSKGELAVQIHAVDQTIELLDGTEQLLYLADSWAIMDELLPMKVPPGDRFEGLSFGGRQLLQLLLAAEGIAGRQASFCMPVIIHIPERHLSAVATELHECNCFGLNRDRVMLVAHPENKGYFFDEETAKFTKAPLSLERPNGTGYAMKQLMWNYEASHLKADGTREVMRKSVMQWLKDLGVTWLHSVQVDDFQRFAQDEAISVGAFALTLKMHKSNNWQMSIQASETSDASVARAKGGFILSAEGDKIQHMEVSDESSSAIVLSKARQNPRLANGRPKGRSACAQHVKTEDLQSPKWTVILDQLQRHNSGKLIKPANRYFFSIAALDKILMRKDTFHTNLHLDGCYVYPHLHMSDVTTAPDARCVAIVPKRPLSDSSLSSAPLDWCEEAIHFMKEQDNYMSFRKAIGKYASQKIILRQKVVDVTQHQRPAKGRNIVLFVNDSRASRMAFDFLIGLVASRVHTSDTLHLMTSVNNQGAIDAANELVQSFQDPMLRFLSVKRDVEVRGFESLVELMHRYCEERSADLVVLGSDLVQESSSASDVFSKSSGGAASSSLGSITLTALRHLLRPVLVVKSTSKCQISRSNGVSEKLRFVLQVEPTVQPTLRFVAGWLDPGRKDLVLVAKPNGIDREGNETMSTRMMLTHFADAVHKHKLAVGKRPLEGSFHHALPDLAYRERAHVIAIQAPQTRELPPELRDLIRESPCAVLVNKTKAANPVELAM